MKKLLFEINYSNDLYPINIKIQYIYGTTFKRYRRDKYYPLKTQGILFIDGFVIGFADVIKHAKDFPNKAYAVRECTKKIMPLIPYRQIRLKLWEMIEAELTQMIPQN